MLVEVGDVSAVGQLSTSSTASALSLTVGAKLLHQGKFGRKCSRINDFPPDTTMVISVMPGLTSSRTVCSITGLSPTGHLFRDGPVSGNGGSRCPAGMTACG